MDTATAGAAWRLRETSTGRVLATHQPAHLDADLWPGSLAKVVTALAALEQGEAHLRVACPRRLAMHGRELDCVHPASALPFTLADALAHSCNTYFVRLAARLDVAAWQALATRLGVPAASGAAPPELVALGLDGPRASAETWRRVLLRALDADTVPAAHRHLVRAALRRAATEGTGVATREAWVDTLVKTGTTMAGTGSEGLAVAVRPDIDRDVVVRVAGGAGRDAAAVAAAVFQQADDERQTFVRLGSADGEVEAIALETYVPRVVSAEAAPGTPAPVLEALAIAARTYAVTQRGRHHTDGFDLCRTTHCQVLADRAGIDAAAAAEATTSLVLSAGGTLRPVFYSAACAGHLHEPREIWGDGQVDARRGGAGLAATAEPHPHEVPTWRSDVTAAALTAALHEAGVRGDTLRGLEVVGGPLSSHPVEVRLGGLVPDRLSAARFRTIVGRALGWHVLKSDDWTATRTATGVRFEGRGKGHGVGLCLAGAVAMARQAGNTVAAADVLRAYYPDLHITSLADRVRLRMAARSEHRGPALLAQIHGTLADLRRTLQTRSPRDLEVVEHPTIEAYQRATGRAWWTGGSTRALSATGVRLDLPPLDAIEGSGALDARLRHELVHVLTARTLADAPLWAVEGLAAHLAPRAGRALEVEGASTGCPSDEDLMRPGSAEAMRALYARAAGCVGAALTGGASWRSLGAPAP